MQLLFQQTYFLFLWWLLIAKHNMETWAKIVTECFRKIRAFTIHKTDKVIISKTSMSLKTKVWEKSAFKLYFP